MSHAGVALARVLPRQHRSDRGRVRTELERIIRSGVDQGPAGSLASRSAGHCRNAQVRQAVPCGAAAAMISRPLRRTLRPAGPGSRRSRPGCAVTYRKGHGSPTRSCCRANRLSVCGFQAWRQRSCCRSSTVRPVSASMFRRVPLATSRPEWTGTVVPRPSGWRITWLAARNARHLEACPL